MEKSKGDRLAGAARPASKGAQDGGMTDGIGASKKCYHKQVCMQSKVSHEAWLHSLGFLDLELLSKNVQALVDTATTHNFMSTDVAKVVGLQLLPNDAEVKVVNSRTKVSGLANEVTVRIADWQGCLDFTVMEMSDFDMILGQEFLKGNRVVVSPSSSEIVIWKDSRWWTIPTHAQRREVSVQYISAPRMNKAMKDPGIETFATVI